MEEQRIEITFIPKEQTEEYRDSIRIDLNAKGR